MMRIRKQAVWAVCALALVGPILGCSQGRPARPDDMIKIIKEQERRYVKPSTGPYAYQCFTDDDLAQFLQSGVPLRAANNVKRSKEFLTAVEAIKALPSDQQNRLLASARRTAQPTWEEQGRMTTDGSGQTLAGQKAELYIANAIVDTAVKLMAHDSENH